MPTYDPSCPIETTPAAPSAPVFVPTSDECPNCVTDGECTGICGSCNFSDASIATVSWNITGHASPDACCIAAANGAADLPYRADLSGVGIHGWSNAIDTNPGLDVEYTCGTATLQYVCSSGLWTLTVHNGHLDEPAWTFSGITDSCSGGTIENPAGDFTSSPACVGEEDIVGGSASIAISNNMGPDGGGCGACPTDVGCCTDDILVTVSGIVAGGESGSCADCTLFNDAYLFTKDIGSCSWNGSGMSITCSPDPDTEAKFWRVAVEQTICGNTTSVAFKAPRIDGQMCPPTTGWEYDAGQSGEDFIDLCNPAGISVTVAYV